MIGIGELAPNYDYEVQFISRYYDVESTSVLLESSGNKCSSKWCCDRTQRKAGLSEQHGFYSCFGSIVSVPITAYSALFDHFPLMTAYEMYIIILQHVAAEWLQLLLSMLSSYTGYSVGEFLQFSLVSQTTWYETKSFNFNSFSQLV